MPGPSIMQRQPRHGRFEISPSRLVSEEKSRNLNGGEKKSGGAGVGKSRIKRKAGVKESRVPGFK
jgi:hypothetical protein